jgi:hypothetical protein
MITPCDPFAPLCFGDACKPYDSDGDGTYDANGCFPPGMAQLGDNCVPVSEGSGDDGCDVGLACAFVDLFGEGLCVEQCGGTLAVPTCATPNTACMSLAGGVRNLCLPTCDPLLQDCPGGSGCYPAYEAWACHLDGLGAPPLDPCGDLDECEPASACIDAALVPGCATASCCSALCDTTGMDPDAGCMLLDPTMICTDWYGPGMAPMGLGNVGICAAP